PLSEPPADVPDYDDGPEFTSLTDAGERNGSESTESSVSLLPRRRPGSSGITGEAPVPHEEPVESAPEQPAAQPVPNTSSFFGSRGGVHRGKRQPPQGHTATSA